MTRILSTCGSALWLAAAAWTAPPTSLVRISGVLTSEYAFEPSGSKAVAMFELIQRHGKQEEVVGRCDRRMWMKSGKQRFRLDMHVTPDHLGQTAHLRVYMLGSWFDHPYAMDMPGLCTHLEEETTLRLAPAVRHIRLKASTSHPLPGG